MKIVVIGGTGLSGSKTVAILRQGGHEVVAASPNSGLNEQPKERATKTLTLSVKMRRMEPPVYSIAGSRSA